MPPSTTNHELRNLLDELLQVSNIQRLAIETTSRPTPINKINLRSIVDEFPVNKIECFYSNAAVKKYLPLLSSSKNIINIELTVDRNCLTTENITLRSGYNILGNFIRVVHNNVLHLTVYRIKNLSFLTYITKEFVIPQNESRYNQSSINANDLPF